LPDVPVSDAEFEFEQAENYRVGRALFDVAAGIKDDIEGGNNDYIGMGRKIISDLLQSTSVAEPVTRGMIYEKVKERFEEYRNMATGKIGDIIPFGIPPIDDKLGGMRKSFVTLIYSKTGGGKTRTAVSIAYNAARAGFNVMYVTLEMAFNFLAACFDSRMGWIDSNKIIFGKLDKKERDRYIEVLKKQVKNKLNVYIVDVAMGAKSALIMKEIELYRATRGVSPDLVIIDYANIMEPMGKYQGRSEKYDNLFKEYHEMAKFYNVSLLTATQESRDASKEDLEARKKSIEVEQGVHKIGLSNFMAPHCENVLRLKQDSTDKLNNRLYVYIDKCRYGTQGSMIPLTAIWGKSYVGDRVVDTGSAMKVYKLKRPGYDE
jgi:replicative DNA helicase